MKLNIGVRLKNPIFRLAALAELIAIVYAFCRVVGLELPVEQQELVDLVGLVAGLLAMLGIVQDPTTPGLQDTDRAMRYDRPGHFSAEGGLAEGQTAEPAPGE